MKLKDAWKGSYDNPRQHIKKQRHYLTNKFPSSQSYGFSSSHIWMWELDCKESWAPKNWCFWTVVLEKSPERLLDCEEIQPINPKGNWSWIFIGRTDVKNWLPGKDLDARKDWKREEKGMTEYEMVEWHHQVNGREFEQVPGGGEGQGNRACCSPWVCK